MKIVVLKAFNDPEGNARRGEVVDRSPELAKRQLLRGFARRVATRRRKPKEATEEKRDGE